MTLNRAVEKLIDDFEIDYKEMVDNSIENTVILHILS